jgi:hypothetical protein
MNSIPDELRTRHELLHTEDISRKMQFGPEYVSMLGGFGKRDKGSNVTLLHSIRDTDLIIDDIIAHEDAKGNTVFTPRSFSKETDEVLLSNTARYVINISDTVIMLYADDVRLKVGYGMAIGKNKPTLVIYSGLDVKKQLSQWDATSDLDKRKQDERIISHSAWSDYVKEWSNFLAFTPAKIELDYNNTLPEKESVPELTTFGAVTFGILLSTNKSFTLKNYKEVEDAAMLEKESGQVGYSTVALRLHEWYNKK